MTAPADRPRLVSHVVLLAAAAVMLLPVWAMLASATHPSGTLSREGLHLLPGDALAANLGRAMSLNPGLSDNVTLGSMVRNSLVSALGIAALTTVLSLLTAFALVFFRLRGAAAVFWLTLVTLLFPLEARMIPTFLVTGQLGLVNTDLGLILPVLPLALGTFFFRQWFLGFPPELQEAAMLDGAGPLAFLRDFVLPLSLTPLAAVFAVAFVSGWNQYLWPVMVSLDDSRFTLMRGIGMTGAGSGPGLVIAAVAMLPPLALLFAVRRSLNRSLPL